MKRNIEHSPTDLTPKAKSLYQSRKSEASIAKSLDFGHQAPPQPSQWTYEEEETLTEYMLNCQHQGEFKEWPPYTDEAFWASAGQYVTIKAHNPICQRTGEACKLKVRRKLRKNFKSLSDASHHYQLPPPGYNNERTQTEQTPCISIGVTETTEDKLRSILAQLEYTHLVREWDSQGVPFRTYAYVPEVDPITGQEFHEREDHVHLLKRIGNCTREGRNPHIDLKYIHEAVKHHESGLTVSTATGARKQSVRDVELLFGPKLAAWLRSREYTAETRYVETILNWHRASDERGLTELQRSKFNYALLNYILDDLMPWHNKHYDFSLLEVNRPVTNICGFTRETLVGLLTNIESKEWVRRENANKDSRPEHPRASSTDDVECFFSVMRDAVGKSFTLQSVQKEWRKICNEYNKRMDSTLQFYYHSSAHDRFYEGEMPSFNDPTERETRLTQIRGARRDMGTLHARGYASIVSQPVRSSVSIRQRFHNVPLPLHPPPALQTHDYC